MTKNLTLSEIADYVRFLENSPLYIREIAKARFLRAMDEIPLLIPEHSVEKAAEWQPIETAPRDGTWFIGYNPDCPMAWAPYEFTSWGTDYTGKSYYCTEDTSDETTCTHWAPFPKPPAK